MKARLSWFFVALLLLAPGLRAAEEDALLELWNKHVATPDDHEGVVKACRAFASANPADPLIPVVHSLEAWHWFRAGRTADAVSMMEPYLTAQPSPTNDGGKRVALGWLSRMDRDRVAASLQVYYRKEVAYPKSLELFASNPKILAEARPPVIDRFGKPWIYTLVGLGKLPGFLDQKYLLQSSTLGDLSDFKTTLALPYASRFPATPGQVIPAPNNTQAVKFTFTATNRPTVLTVGQASGDLYLAFVGSRIVVACDYTHWKVFPRP